MKVYLSLGDYYDDGHGRYRNFLVTVKNKEDIHTAHQAVLEKYGKRFFDGFATRYNNPSISQEVFSTLQSLGFPFKVEDPNEEVWDWCWDDFGQYSGSEDFFQEYPETKSYGSFSIEMIGTLYIYLLNAFGAGIIIEEEYDVVAADDGIGYGCLGG